MRKRYICLCMCMSVMMCNVKLFGLCSSMNSFKSIFIRPHFFHQKLKDTLELVVFFFFCFFFLFRFLVLLWRRVSTKQLTHTLEYEWQTLNSGKMYIRIFKYFEKRKKNEKKNQNQINRTSNNAEQAWRLCHNNNNPFFSIFVVVSVQLFFGAYKFCLRSMLCS